MRKKLSRRDFVKLGSSSLLLPILPSLFSQAAYGAGAPPLRIVFLVSWNGVHESSYWPANPTTVVAPDIRSKKLVEYGNGPLSGVLNSDLNSLRNKFSIMRGLAYQIPHKRCR